MSGTNRGIRRLRLRAARRDRPGWLPGLDGLRAVAVLAVIGYHIVPDQLPGGFLGVDVFFAISGYLITRLLLRELADTGSIAVVRFWTRRWRRLVPAVLALLAVLAVGATTVWRDQLTYLRSGILASFGYVTNWWLIYDHHSYFVTSGRPPMIQHLWSLAIEEQFYLLWPFVVALLTGAAVHVRRRLAARGPGYVDAEALVRLAIGCVVLGTASAIALATLAVRDDVPLGHDSARLYYGTDTHAMGLLFGAGLGALSMLGQARTARPWRGRLRRRAARVAGDAVAMAAAGLVGWQLLTASEYSPRLYTVGFAGVGLAAAVLVATVVRPGSVVGRVLDVAPLRWIGRRSYSIYLWYWPVVVALRPGLDVPGPTWVIHPLQVVLILLLGSLSYRYVEQPFRVGGPAVRRPAWRLDHRRRAGLAVVTAAALVAALIATLPKTATHPVADRPPTTGPTAIAYVPPPVRTSARTKRAATKKAVRHTNAKPSAINPTTVTVSAFGDSVMLGAAPALIKTLPRASVFAVEGRQARAVFADIAHRRSGLGKIVVIHAGDNGVISSADLKATLRSLHGCERIVLVNVRVDRDWERHNNKVLSVVAKQFGNVRLVNWYSVSAPHHGWFWKDGLHLRPAGAQAYAQLIKQAVSDR